MQTPRLIVRCWAEFLGTMVLLLLGSGVVAMTVLFGEGRPNEIVNGGYTNITIGWGLAVALGVYLTGRISGAHLNPAVTVALAVFRRFPWREVLPYAAAQVAGAFAGAALVYWNYRPQIDRFDPLREKTGGVFTTFPAFPSLPEVGLLDQVIGTALLLLLIAALTDERNQMPSANLAPLSIGLVVVAIGMGFGGLHGYAINPARDLGPRLMIVCAGYARNGLTDGTGLFWVPIIGPLIGGIVGQAVYELGVRRFLR